ncbi:MAG: 5'-methylthioadenosine/adenosylhomocysteine nucleosidase [Erysipelotrichales bacterium]|nr:MAG: 5'-methylthioadenosine/adenosylhomocysteine nucleosidase [Erysipelotrichales bacterium]
MFHLRLQRRFTMIAIIGAMQEEINEIVKRMDSHQEQIIDGCKFYHGMLNGSEIVAMLSGIGKVEAALSTVICLKNFAIDGIINIGTAGGLHPDQEVLDVVLSTQTAYHDFDLTAFGEARGFASSRYVCTAEPRYIDAFKRVIGKARHWIGPIVSGDQFVADPIAVAQIKSAFPDAICVEMEGASIAHTAGRFKIPFVILRSLSDIAGKHGNAMTFDEYLVQASAHSAQWCYEVMPLLRGDNDAYVA